MLQQIKINMGNLLLSLSNALELVDPYLSLHQMRTAYISWVMGESVGLSSERVESLFTAALLHDIGALTLEEKVSLHRSEALDPEAHCLRGEALLHSVPWLQAGSYAIRYHHTPYKYMPGSISEDGVLEAQILFLADEVERSIRRNQYILDQQEDVTAKVRAMNESKVHPDLVERFLAVSNREEFWLDLVSPRLYSILLHQGPFRDMAGSEKVLAEIGQLFRHVIDFRSRFTATHSSGVAICAATLARLLGFAEYEIQLMEIAGNFHDLGKMAVPNSILEKPSGLTREEFAVIRQHTYWTYTMLVSIGGLEQVAEWAAFHHERLDGTGYPFHVGAERLSLGARIMAVADIFTALIEDRPYRSGMSREQSTSIMIQQGKRGFLDSKVIQVLIDNYELLTQSVKDEQAAARKFYESKFSTTA